MEMRYQHFELMQYQNPSRPYPYHVSLHVDFKTMKDRKNFIKKVKEILKE